MSLLNRCLHSTSC